MNKRTKNLLTVLCMLFLAQTAIAQGSHWGDFDYRQFQYDMTVYFTLQHGEGAEATPFAATDLENYEIAAFVNGELRGIGEWQSTVVGGETKKWGYIRVYAKVANGETVTFKYYDKNASKEKSVFGNTGKIDFVHQAQVGKPSAPHGFDMDNNVLTGDANGDGEIDLTDAVNIFDFFMGEDVEDFNEDAADFDGDGVVDLSDAVAIFEYYMNQ